MDTDLKKPKRARYVVTKEHWKPQHTQMLILVQKNTPMDKICAKFSMSKQHLDKIRYSPYFQERLNSLSSKIEERIIEKTADVTVHDKVREHLLKTSMTAAKLLTKALKNPKALNQIQLRVCQDILDRSGHKPKEVIETHERVFAPEEISSALETVKELELTVDRLSNVGNPFVLSHEERHNTRRQVTLENADTSSDTDESSDVSESPIEGARSPGPEPLST